MFFAKKVFSSDMKARLAQSVEHETLNLRVVGSSPTLGAQILSFKSCLFKQPANGFCRLGVDFRDEIRTFFGWAIKSWSQGWRICFQFFSFRKFVTTGLASSVGRA